MLKYAAQEFCMNTGLHGYKYIFLPKRTLLERIIWAVIVIISLTVGIITTLYAWKEISSHVVQTVTDSTHNPIWNYPFPAVTVCNFNKISKAKAYQAVNTIQRPSNVSAQKMTEYLRYLPLLIPTESNVPQQNLIQLQNILEKNNVSAHKLFQNLAPNCTEMMLRCKWKGEEKRCEALFEQIAIPLGFCCSFNYFAIKNHNFPGSSAHKIPTRPRRVTACGYKTALEVVIDNRANDYFISDMASYGHKILVHHPYTYPDCSIRSLLLEIKTTMYLSVSPVITECSQAAAELPIEKRNCLFRKEMEMYRFKHYTHHNCLTECRVHMYFKYCKCIPFYYYSRNGTFHYRRICNLRDVSCLTKYRPIIESSIPGVDKALYGTYKNSQNKTDYCKCLPDCENCIYPIECSNGEVSNEYTMFQNFYTGAIMKNQSVVRVFFSDLVATRNTKIVRNHWHTIFALLGGLMSLFTGFSFGTGFELLYFLTIRLLIMKVNKEDTQRKGVYENNIMVKCSALNKNLQKQQEYNFNSNQENEKSVRTVSENMWPFVN